MVSAKQKLELANCIAEIIPLDPETCNQMIDYALTLKGEAEIRSHFLNLLGESDATDEFLIKFMDIKNTSKSKSNKGQSISNFAEPPEPKKDVKNPWSKANGKEYSKSPTPTVKNPEPSRKSKAPKNTSDLITSKQKEVPKDNKKSRKKNLESLKDLESVLNSLEVSKSKDSRTVCYCNATRHPLFDIAPNCLNCGKIICSKEGLQPCSFCGHELLSEKERREIEQVLLLEKLELENGSKALRQEIKEDSPKPQKSKKIVVSMNAGENLWQAQERALKQAEEEKKLHHEQLEQERKQQEIHNQQKTELDYYERIGESDKDLIEAQERLDRLLEFQETGEERTKIIDNAADYELTSSTTGNMWLSATERALRLKKQQKQLRKHEEAEQKRIGKGKRNVEMVIKDGKVHMVETFSSPQEDLENDKEIQELEGEIKSKKQMSEKQLSQNYWDFDSDKDKWERPVYISNRNYNNSQSQAEIFDRELQKRVQLTNGDDQTELIANMY